MRSLLAWFTVAGTVAGSVALVGSAALCSAAQEIPPAVEKPAEKPAERVRRLTLSTPIDSLANFDSSMLATADDVEKYVGKPAAQELAKQVDFSKETVAVFGFTTGGPPFGVEKWEIKKEGDKEWVEFFVEEPDSPVRGRALKIGRAFFAVPKGMEVRFEGKRPAPRR